MTNWMFVLVALAVLAAVSVAIFRFFRTRALTVEHSSSSVADKVHRLQRLQLSALGVGLLIEVAGFGGGGALLGVATRHDRHPGALAAAGLIALGIVGLALILTPLIVAARAIRPSVARVRDVPLRTPNKRRTATAAVAVWVPYFLLLSVGTRLIPRHGAGHSIGFVVLYFVAVVVLASVLTPLILVRILSKPMKPDEAERMQHLADTMGVRVRGFRVLSGSNQKVANAMQVGTLPGLRYILVTDYLVEHVTEPQLEAVVAHELGHARRHHIAIKLGAVFGLWVALEAVAAGIVAIAGNSWAAVLAVPIVIALPIGVIVVQGLVGIRLEEAADEIAAESVGRDHMVTALEKLGDLNDTKRNTGRSWAILTQHPGLQTRIDHLRAMPPN